jgi:hypothetical protein
MNASAGGVSSCDLAGSIGGGLDEGATGSATFANSPSIGEQLANSPTTDDSLKNSKNSHSALESSIGTPSDKGEASTQGKQQANDAHRAIDDNTQTAGIITATSTATVTAVATNTHQKAIQGPVEHAIAPLEASKNPVQIEKAEALREANKPDGLKGTLYPNAVEYNVDKTLEARNNVLSDKSVIGNKLENDLRKVSTKIDIAESIAKKAGVIGIVAGPVISSASEIAKLDEKPSGAEQITAGIVGAIKTADNETVGIAAGATVGLATSLSGPGAVVAGTAAGLATDEGYKLSGADKKFDNFIDQSVAPVIQAGVETGLDAIITTVEVSAKAVDNIQETASDYFNDWFDDENGSTHP